MDTNAALQELLDVARAVHHAEQTRSIMAEPVDADAATLAHHVLALHDALASGAVLPAAWSNCPPGDEDGGTRCHPGDCDGDGGRCGFTCHICS